MKLKTDSPQSISILYVEDDEITLKLQSTILAVKFPEVVISTAINGRVGLELFKAYMPDIVITDINMSEMCGVQLAENIRAFRPDTKIIAITGRSGETSVVGKFIKSTSDEKMVEFDHVIIKPVDIAELYGVIERCIGEIEQRIS